MATFDAVVRLAMGTMVVSELPSKLQPPLPVGPACLIATPFTVTDEGGQSAGSLSV